jgi:hypothetical protein
VQAAAAARAAAESERDTAAAQLKTVAAEAAQERSVARVELLSAQQVRGCAWTLPPPSPPPPPPHTHQQPHLQMTDSHLGCTPQRLAERERALDASQASLREAQELIVRWRPQWTPIPYTHAPA